MERSLLTWSVPNMLTIWLMVLALLMLWTVGAQVVMRKRAPAQANNSGAF